MASSFVNKRKQTRLENSSDQTLNEQTYNLVLGLVVAYGIIMNIILCNCFPNILEYISPAALYIIYFICALAGILISNFSHNALISFLGYNLVVIPIGMVISATLTYYGGVNSDVVSQAFLYTACMTAVMIVISILKPSLFQHLGKYLFVTLIAVSIGSFIGIFIEGVWVVTSWISAVLFSFYIGYDMYRAQQYSKTLDNAVDCAVDIYLDIANLFLRLLSIFGRKSD